MTTTKLPLRKVLHPDFTWALSTLTNAQVPAKAAWWLARIFKAAQKQEKQYNETRLTALKKYAELTADGNPETDDRKQVVFKNDSDKESFLKEIEELLDEEVEVPVMQFALFGDNTQLETRHLIILEDVIVQ